MSDQIDHNIKSKFEETAKRANVLPEQPPEILLEMYGLYKQALKGDVTGKRPGGLDIKGKYKYDAWASRKGMSKEDAMKAYIELIKKLENP